MWALKKIRVALLDLFFGVDGTEQKIRHLTAEDLARLLTERNENDVVSYYSYREPLVREVLLRLKFHQHTTLGKLLAETLYERLLETISEQLYVPGTPKPLLIPIPLAKERLRERGYNQVEKVARELEALDQERSFELELNVLRKVRNTPPQTSLFEKKDREENVRAAFAVANAARIAGRSIILLDDIVTTGSTLREASAALRAAGAGPILCIAIAH